MSRNEKCTNFQTVEDNKYNGRGRKAVRCMRKWQRTPCMFHEYECLVLEPSNRQWREICMLFDRTSAYTWAAIYYIRAVLVSLHS